MIRISRAIGHTNINKSLRYATRFLLYKARPNRTSKCSCKFEVILSIEEKMNSDNRNEEEYKIRKTYYALPDAPEYTYCA